MPKPKTSNLKLQGPFDLILRNQSQERYLKVGEFIVKPQTERAIPSLLAFCEIAVPSDRKLIEMLETLVPEWKRDNEVFRSEPELAERIFSLFGSKANKYQLEQLASRHQEHLGKIIEFAEMIGAQKEKQILQDILKKTFQARD